MLRNVVEAEPISRTGVRRGVEIWFFRNFFALLLLVVSAGQWIFIWWLLWPAALSSLLVHPLGILAVYTFNRQVTRGRYARHHARPRWRRAYDAFAFVSFFCAVFLVVMTALQLVAHLFAGGTTAAATAGNVDLLFRWATNGGVGLIVLTLAYGYTIGQAQLIVTRLRLPLRNFEKLNGLRIAQISDIHVGPGLHLDQLETFVERVNALDADLVCITGDIADNASSDLTKAFPVLGRLRARRAVIAILGNHDHYAGARRVVEALQRYTEFIVLQDDHVRLDIDGTPLNVIGLDDRGVDWARGVTETPYLAEAMSAVAPAEPALVLCHRPDIFRQSAALGAGLTLSGHTHGGQIALPWLNGKRVNPARIATPFDRGLFEENKRFLYVNNGLGVTFQRLRLCTPREILLVEVDGHAEKAA